MEKVTAYFIRHRAIVILVFLGLLVLSLLALPLVQVNYDLAKYLPETSMTKRAITVLEDEFGYPGMAQVMVEDVSIPQAINAKKQILAVDGVKNVIWLDDLTDVLVPLSIIPRELLNEYYREGNALFQVEFTESNYSLSAGSALEEIRNVVGDKVCITGAAEDSRHMRAVLSSEILKISLIVVPLCFIILMFASQSWIEPILYLVVIGTSIALNMGSNIFFTSISFITHAMAAVLQLAISMDYSLFLCHRYMEERDRGNDALTAVLAATKKSLSSISASSLTTIAGFLALIFMQYTIGADIGLVLAKGILISFICVIVLLPILIMMTHKIIDKTRHKQFLPPFRQFGRFAIKLRHLIILLAIVVLIPSYLAQSNNTFLYGDTTGSAGDLEAAQQRERIESLFGVSNPIVVLVPNDDLASEILLAQELQAQPFVKSVNSLVTLADPAIPREFLPQELKDNFLSNGYSRIIVNLEINGETPETFAAVEEIQSALQAYYPDSWLTAGTSTSLADIRANVESDNFVVSLFSILAVGLIILFTFRSLSIPILLVAVIQGSIWINMGVPYFAGSSLAFIGYLVVKTLQLGATIDYAILLSNRYMEFRLSQAPKEAALSALSSSGSSVLVSALILTVAGLAEGLLSRIDAISEIGILLGRGAALSGILVLTLLPILLIIFDGLIMRTTLGTKAILENQKSRSEKA